MDHGLIRVALGMQLGGAIGNLIDRVRLGEVTDFIDVGRFPTFNVADASISVSIVAVLIFFVLQEADEAARERSPHADPMPEPRRPRRLSSSPTRAGERLDVFVARLLPDLTRSRVQRLIDDGHVTVAGQRAKRVAAARAGPARAVEVPPPSSPRRCARGDPARRASTRTPICSSSTSPPGMTVHPSPGHAIVDAGERDPRALRDLSGIGGVLRPGIVHRLDRDTSGVILVAKNDAAHNALARQLKDRTVEKTYVALVEGTPKPAEGVIDAPIARDPRNRQRMAVVDGRPRSR